MSDEQHLAGAVARIWKVTIALAVAGSILLLIWLGWSWSAGFALGAGISALNFHWLKRVATSLGSAQAKPRMAVILGLRYVILGGIAYGILKYSAVSLPAMFWGLFVTVAAVILEILFELVYARNGTLDH
jgi:TRAP-type C4-dicarboxylate transport system permease small subunit